MKLPNDVKRFIILVVFFGWASVIPLWNHPGKLEHPMSGVILIVFLFIPTLTAFYVSVMNNEPDKKSVFAWNFSNKWKFHSVIQWATWPSIAFLSLLLGDLFGAYQIDLQFSGFNHLITDMISTFSDNNGQPLIELPMTTKQIAYSYLLVLFMSPLVLGLMTIGQELAWRGWLLSKLLHLGEHKAIILSNLIWGIWYIPIALLGYRYPGYSLLSVFLTLGFCMIVGTILAWSRLKTNSIAPSIIGHAAVNGSAPLVHIFFQKGSDVNIVLVGAQGVIGLAIASLMVFYLMSKDDFRIEGPLIEQRR